MTPELLQNYTFPLKKLSYTKLKTFSLTSNIAELGGGNNSQLNARPSGDFKGPQCDRLTSGLRMGRRAGNHAALQRFKFMSPRKNLPFKEQMLPPLYQNHLFVFIALVSYLNASQPRLI